MGRGADAPRPMEAYSVLTGGSDGELARNLLTSEPRQGVTGSHRGSQGSQGSHRGHRGHKGQG
eukprot:6693612-Prymnesium_polylepis.1